MQWSNKTRLGLAAGLLAIGSMTTAVVQGTEASSVLASETRPLESSITGVHLNGSINLKLKQGTTSTLIIRAERKVLPNIETVREGNTLRIGTRGSFTTNQSVIAEMTLPSLRQLQVTGSGDSEASGFSGDRLKLSSSGSGSMVFNGRYQNVEANLHGSGALKLNAGDSERIELGLFGSGDMVATGRSKTLTAKLAGSGDLDARQLETESATVSIYGTGNASVHASRTVAISSRGTGDVDVYGKPPQRAVSTSGTGSVQWK